MSEPTDNPPAGVVGIYTAEDGHVVTSVSEFNQDSYGGCKLEESQRWRVQRRLAQAVVRAYCSPVVSDALGAYDCEQIVKKLKGKMTFVAVGHSQSDVERLNP